MNMLEVSYLSRLVSNLTVKFVRQQREKSPIENDIPHKAITFVRSKNTPIRGKLPLDGTGMGSNREVEPDHAHRPKRA